MTQIFRASTRLLAAAATGLAVTAAGAQALPPSQNVLTLTANASVEVAMDWLTVVFSTTREGPDAGAVQAALRQALDAALAEARKAARPGQVEVQTGTFSLLPRYAPAGSKAPGLPAGIVGWQGSVELVVQGRDTQAIAQLTGRIRTLSIARVGQALSREAREQVEGDVAAEAITRFRNRAEAVARQFGYGSYAVREVTVGSNDPAQGGVMPMLRMQAARAPTDDSLPVEAGKAVVSATVAGSVQMR
jgi:predicted secreted protein